MNISEVREDMKVVGSDRQPVGTVDHVEGERIKLTGNDPQANGQHHYIPSDWVDRVEGNEVKLSKSANDARSNWQT